jgi:hypothetical protein
MRQQDAAKLHYVIHIEYAANLIMQKGQNRNEV